MSTEILDQLCRAVRDMDVEGAVAAAHQALDREIDPVEAINRGLLRGMEEAGRLFEEGEYFVPELMMCADAMYAGMDVLSPHLKRDDRQRGETVVIGVVEGDTHDIGKNLVKLMLEVAGFHVVDLGRDVPAVRFVETLRETGARMLCLSTLMSTTMNRMAEVIQDLQKEGLREQVKIAVGGGPVSQSFCNRIGADGYASNATGAARLVKRLLGQGDE